MKTLETFKHEKGITRVKIKIMYVDNLDFLTPMFVPSNHEDVKKN